MSKKKLSKVEFTELVNSMSEEQFDDFAKAHKKEINQIKSWVQGEDVYTPKSSYKISIGIIELIVQIEDLEAYLHENPEDTTSSEQIALLNFKLEEEFNNLEDKVDVFGKTLRELNNKVENFEKEADYYKKRAKVTSNKIERFKQRIVNIIQGLQLTEIEGEIHKMKLTEPSYSVVINEMTDEEMEYIPSHFKRQTVVIDKGVVKAALQVGEVLTWATLVPKVGLKVT